MDHSRLKIIKQIKLLSVIVMLNFSTITFSADSKSDEFNPQEEIKSSLEKFRNINAMYGAGGEDFLELFNNEVIGALSARLGTWKLAQAKKPTDHEVSSQADDLVYKKFNEIAKSQSKKSSPCKDAGDRCTFGF